MALEFLRGRTARDQASAADINGDDAEVYVLLKRAYATHCLLTVYVGPEKTPFTSAILEVVRDQRYLVLDELTPAAGHARIQAEPRIEVRAIVEGIELRFESRVEQVGEQDGLPFYKVSFPAEVTYAQRRRQHRVAVPLSQGFEVNVVFSDERELRGELRDLSAGGLCARVRSGDIDAKTDRGALAMCRLVLPDDRSIVTDIEILHIDAPPRPRVPRIGVQFVDPSPTVARRIAQFCAELERMQRKVR
jgi:c-di-GMP-binding flagellar brake protein YcgR